MSRVLAWFSCGDPSAAAAKLAVEKYGDRCEVFYTDTLAYEHIDNLRFMRDVEKWIGKEIKILRSKQYRDIFDVFDRTGWLIGPQGARCTTELKRDVRRRFQRDDDIQVFGLCDDKEDRHRVPRMVKENPNVNFDWILFDQGLTKRDCHRMVREAGIELPMMYRLGYKNNNCIGCVKGQAGYWNKIRIDFPEVYARMAAQERKMDVAINKRYEGKTRIRVFLDELPPDAGRYEVEPDIECGVLCVTGQSGHAEDIPEEQPA